MQHIVLLCLFSNGDCLISTAIARQIKFDYPGCFLEWIISKKCRSMLENNPNVDSIREIDMDNISSVEVFFEKLVSGLERDVESGKYSKLFISQLMGLNFVFYDGLIATSIMRAYGSPITTGYRPDLFLYNTEIERAKNFFQENCLHKFTDVIIFECAPQSGQFLMTNEIILAICKELIKVSDVAIILSSPYNYDFSNSNIINGSSLSIRETVALARYSTLFLGCSSGITWAMQSNSVKPIPSIQILDKNAYYFNPVVLNFEKFGLNTDNYISLSEFNSKKIAEVFYSIKRYGFAFSKSKYDQKMTKQFRLYRGIIQSFIIKIRFRKLAQFVSMNLIENKFSVRMLAFVFLGFLLFPYDYLRRFLIKYRSVREKT